MNRYRELGSLPEICEQVSEIGLLLESLQWWEVSGITLKYQLALIIHIYFENTLNSSISLFNSGRGACLRHAKNTTSCITALWPHALRHCDLMPHGNANTWVTAMRPHASRQCDIKPHGNVTSCLTAMWPHASRQCDRMPHGNVTSCLMAMWPHASW